MIRVVKKNCNEFEFDENGWDIKGLLSYGKLACFLSLFSK